jgi:hypothetical protein
VTDRFPLPSEFNANRSTHADINTTNRDYGKVNVVFFYRTKRGAESPNLVL